MASIYNWLVAMSFSTRLLTLRKEKGLTQQGLADVTGIHVQQIKRYEAGTSQPSADALKKVAKSFSVSTDWLLFEDGERGPDDELKLQFEAISHMPKKERLIIQELLDGMILKYEAKRWSSRAET